MTRVYIGVDGIIHEAVESMSKKYNVDKNELLNAVYEEYAYSKNPPTKREEIFRLVEQVCKSLKW